MQTEVNRGRRGSRRILLGLGGLAALISCVSARDARNGVFNENQYIRKDFLVRSGTSTASDPGWFMKATVVSVSTPNPLGDMFIYPGMENGGAWVRFEITQDRLNLLNMREVNNNPSPYQNPEIVNAWGITNVDLKYRINLDGETTNFYEENQEADWQVRQWVKINLANNTMSDVAPFGGAVNDLLGHCVDMGNVTATLEDGTFKVDEKNDYMQWVVSITMPLRWSDATCVTAYGGLGNTAAHIGRQDVTFKLMYSFLRAKPLEQVTYKPMVVAEKDPIRHKYGWFETVTIARDNDSGQLASRQLVNRFDPDKPIVWYFAEGFPEQYKPLFKDMSGMGTDPNTIEGATNQIFEQAGAKARVQFKEWNEDPKNPKRPGDIRYSFLIWMSDRDVQTYWAGLTPSVNDPRTGESISSTLWLNDFAIKDYYVQRLDAYLKTLGASADVNSAGDWPDLGSCNDGDTLPIVTASVAESHNKASSLFQKMQQYLPRPTTAAPGIPLGPKDFTAQQDDDFFHAYYALLPYYVFADPDTNPFVIPEGGGGVYGSDGGIGAAGFWSHIEKEAQFQTMAAKIDRGEAPFPVVGGAVGVADATGFLNTMRDLTIAHRDFNYAKHFVLQGMRADAPDAFSYEQVIARDARHCINGKWETKQQWIDGLIMTYWQQVFWHEFGHSLGLTHNFMASLDKNNFPTYTDKQGQQHYGLYASSVMEYNAAPDRIFWKPGWGPYDRGAISFIYGNTTPNGTPSTGITGQASKTAPWNDPLGFDDAGNEKVFLFCNEYHMKYTPLCRQGDLGVTPSQIVANEIEGYDWQYHWANFRSYRKFWDNSSYANVPAGMVTELRRFLSLWAFDWSTSELADSLRRIGITNPNPNGSDLQYYTQLTNKFNAEISAANQMAAAFHKAVIQQSSGERPYRTIYDKYYGDVTQQGIILDKLFAMQGWVALWPTDNYDLNQAGSYISSYSELGDGSYRSVAEDAVASMVGGQYDVYPYFVPLAVAQFAQDTHSPNFGGRVDVRDWIGGQVFNRLDDFLTYFRSLAVQNNLPGCATDDACKYDPRPLSDTHNEFNGPDRRRWIWAYIADRNQWVAVQKDRNVASYLIVRAYTDDVIAQQDDGNFPGGAFSAELQMKYFLDSFRQYN